MVGHTSKSGSGAVYRMGLRESQDEDRDLLIIAVNDNSYCNQLFLTTETGRVNSSPKWVVSESYAQKWTEEESKQLIVRFLDPTDSEMQNLRADAFRRNDTGKIFVTRKTYPVIEAIC